MNPNSVYIFVADINDINETEITKTRFASFEAKRVSRIMKCQNSTERRRLIATGLLVENVFGRYGYIPSQIGYRGKQDKPVVEGGTDFWFNISHSGDYVVMAVSGSEVGVDIQKKVPFKQALADRIMSEDEKASCKDTAVDIARIWAQKEAYVKLTGDGIAKDFRQLSICEADGCIYECGIRKAYIKEIAFCSEMYIFAACGENFVFEGVERVALKI